VDRAGEGIAVVMEPLSIDAPAKINLGLEILGRRADGFHEIRTVMAMLELADTVTIGPAGSLPGTGMAGLPAEVNLVQRALELFLARSPGVPPLEWHVGKRIPVAAGLGGASSNAAVALVAANRLAGDPLDHRDLVDLAARLGSDVPFFLGSPFALASGRGTSLEALPALLLDVLLIVPGIAIPQKTPTLYGLVEPRDYADGRFAERIAGNVRRGLAPSGADLFNSFWRPLHELLPHMDEVATAVAETGAAPIALTGAGPTHVVLGGGDELDAIAAMLSDRFGSWIDTIRTVTRTASPLHQITPNAPGIQR
jgi:4-diphosphocytidyl-2-C-methyl-D-erythritol kinase